MAAAYCPGFRSSVSASHRNPTFPVLLVSPLIKKLFEWAPERWDDASCAHAASDLALSSTHSKWALFSFPSPGTQVLLGKLRLRSSCVFRVVSCVHQCAYWRRSADCNSTRSSQGFAIRNQDTPLCWKYGRQGSRGKLREVFSITLPLTHTCSWVVVFTFAWCWLTVRNCTWTNTIWVLVTWFLIYLHQFAHYT